MNAPDLPVTMFVPPEYEPVRHEQLIELIRAHPLALLVTATESGPYATHLPVVLADDAGRTADGPDTLTLLGHLNRANPHFAALARDVPSLLVFAGPGGYVSPRIYRTTPAAPTWNFASVHARGPVRVLDQGAATRQVVAATARLLEARFGRQWDATGSYDYFERLLPGVGAFMMTATDVRGMFKLSQEKDNAVRDRVAAAFGEDGNAELAALMARCPVAHPPTGEARQ
ncbi:MAG TPA: FMN-binding negative transcriptional regulator [Pseudonocardiaceae bacterium]|jgi:transcriptional regulator|nr:FMN-binding negative transcriptional regulator [Pseudonocardiaceae bacterium]